MMQHSLSLYKCLLSVDVGAVSNRNLPLPPGIVTYYFYNKVTNRAVPNGVKMTDQVRHELSAATRRNSLFILYNAKNALFLSQKYVRI